MASKHSQQIGEAAEQRRNQSDHLSKRAIRSMTKRPFAEDTRDRKC